MIRRLGAALATTVLILAWSPAAAVDTEGAGQPARPHRPGTATGWPSARAWAAQAAEKPGLTFVSQTLWREGSGPAELRFRVTTEAPADTVEVAVAVYPRLTSRSEFALSLDGRGRRSALTLQRFPLTALAADPTGVISLPLDLSLGRQGVYPIRVELRETATGDVIDAFNSHLVHIPAPIEGEKLSVGLAVPFRTDAVTTADGLFNLDQMEVDRLARLAGALGATPIPLTILPRGETLDALANSTSVEGRPALTALGAAAPGRLLLPQHYVDTSLPGLLRAGLANEAERQAVRAAAAVGAQVSGADISAGIWVSDQPVDAATLRFLANRGVTRIVVPERALVPLDLDITLTQTFALPAGDQRLLAASTDPDLQSHFLSVEEPALAAQHLLADLAVLYFDRPGLRRGVAVVPPATWKADPRFVAALLVGLADSPVLASQSLAGMFDAVPPLERRGETQVRGLADGDAAQATVIDGPAVRSVRRRLDSLVSVLSPFNPIVEQVDRTILASESSQLRRSGRTQLLAGADGQIDAVLDKVSLPGSRSITLTAREGEIPVTISSQIPYPIHAALRLRSGPLSFPRGDTIPVELTRSNLTQRVTVRANTSGSFPLRVELVSPDGGLVLGETRVTVRSTAVSGVGVALSVGAALFLALWWARHLRGRRSKRLVPT